MSQRSAERRPRQKGRTTPRQRRDVSRANSLGARGVPLVHADVPATDVVGRLARPCSFRRSASLASPARNEMPPKESPKGFKRGTPAIVNDGAAGAEKQTAGGALPMRMRIASYTLSTQPGK